MNTSVYNHYVHNTSNENYMLEIKIIIPGIESSLNGDDSVAALDQYPALNALKTKAKQQSHQGITYRRYLFNCFDLAAEAYAAVTAVTYNLPADQGYWLQLTPVQLMADMAGVYMLGYEHLAITADEQQQIKEHIIPLIDNKSWQLFAVATDCYLLNLPNSVAITSIPPDEIVGKEIGAYLLTGDAKHQWLRLQDEIQMQIQSLNFNMQRQSEGRAVVNGVWLWGRGVYLRP